MTSSISNCLIHIIFCTVDVTRQIRAKLGTILIRKSMFDLDIRSPLEGFACFTQNLLGIVVSRYTKAISGRTTEMMQSQMDALRVIGFWAVNFVGIQCLIN